MSKSVRTKRAVLAASSAMLACAVHADGLDPIVGAIGESKPIFDTRLRYEDVNQEPMANDARAVTLRARLGFETGKAWETALLVEGDLISPLTSDYNSTTNGETEYPTVVDPETYEINRLQLVNTKLPGTTVTLGRQRILLDDQRFVGNVGWRQNEQTFDALRVVNKSIANLTFDVSYVEQVNRIYGKESVQGRYEGESLLANVSYQFPIGKLTGFGYKIEIDPIALASAAVRDSSETYGVRFAGERPLSKIKVGYIASYATQEDAGENPLQFDNDYYLLELTGTYRQYSLGVGVEVLEGDGIKGFTTPLATLHKFQGWADKFLATPVNGIDDRYVNAGVTLKGVGPLDTLTAQASYHTYEAEHISFDYGTEFDMQVQAKWHRFLGTLKYADYKADQLLTDTTKFWVQLDYVW